MKSRSEKQNVLSGLDIIQAECIIGVITWEIVVRKENGKLGHRDIGDTGVCIGHHPFEQGRLKELPCQFVCFTFYKSEIMNSGTTVRRQLPWVTRLTYFSWGLKVRGE